MGIAHGQFIPSQNYGSIQHLVVGTYGNQKHLELAILTEQGRDLSCEWIAINDQSNEFGVEGLYIELATTSASVYQEFFPHHLAEYSKRFA